MKKSGPSVIIAFYNNIRFLKLVLAGFSRQSLKDFEIIIADDGSKDEVRKEVASISESYPFPVRHLWHEDLGWRKNIMLNKAIVQSESDYLIFIDADCIPHKHFIREHVRNRERNKILSGRRVNLSGEITETLTPEVVVSGYLDKNTMKWLYEGLKKKVTHAEKGLYLPWMTSYLTRKNFGLSGCNFSIYKDDIEMLNGFDERYMAPTVGEDTELEWRAGQAGIKIKSVRNLAIQYHLYHPKLSRENNNMAIFEDTKAKKYSRTPYGIIKDNAN